LFAHNNLVLETRRQFLAGPILFAFFPLASWVRQHKPEIKVVLSAAADRTAKVAGDLCEEGPHLAKPYDQAMVLEHIKRLRGGAGGPTSQAAA
jgi:hypothetical protein